MKRNFRLAKSSEFKRVRRNGRSYAHPLIVLIVLPRGEGHSRFGISAGRSVGTAVRRNRAKRMIREVLRNMVSEIEDGWDIILLSRHPLPDASLSDVQSALTQLLSRADLLIEENGI